VIFFFGSKESENNATFLLSRPMPRIVNGEIVPDNYPTQNDGNRRQATPPTNGAGIFETLNEQVVVFGTPLSKQILIGIGVAVAFLGGVQFLLIYALIVYFGITYNPAPAPATPAARSTQYATTTGTHTYSNDENRNGGDNTGNSEGGWLSSILGPAPSQNQMARQQPNFGSRTFKKDGNIVTLGN